MGSLGPLSGPMCVILGRSWGLCGRSWAAPRPSVGGLGRLLGLMWLLGPLRAILGRSRASVGGLGSLLGPLRAILGRSWASVGGLGPLSGPLLAILYRSWGLCWRSWAVLGRKVTQALAGRRSGKRICAEKWPKPEREGRSGEGTDSRRSLALRNFLPNFSCRYERGPVALQRQS